MIWEAMLGELGLAWQRPQSLNQWLEMVKANTHYNKKDVLCREPSRYYGQYGRNGISESSTRGLVRGRMYGRLQRGVSSPGYARSQTFQALVME
ncbi:hypothetical protein Syun_002089 [Stephania yunnanensis]|uniref:Uncharacterized protein n=1 Tax=Stephania yunnanensis TaxID=152371 RepID=A0AAP0LJ43_9MAGN